jgi:hypothetical protein
MTGLDPRNEKAFTFAQEATKQLITLSTAVIALTITFLNDVLQTAPPGSAPYLEVAWVLYLVSIAFGVFTLLALAGSLGTRKPTNPSIYDWNIKVPAILQVVFFCAAMALTLVFGFMAV